MKSQEKLNRVMAKSIYQLANERIDHNKREFATLKINKL